MQSSLFSVIILHYNQQKYILKALESVLCQDYPNLEIILADDGTANFDISIVQDFVKERRQENLCRFEISVSSENVGTAANLNRVLPQTKGEYILCFAADDVLYDEHVLTQFAKQLGGLSENDLCVSAQCLMMDEKLEQLLPAFTNVPLLTHLNRCTAQKQFAALQTELIYALGASAFKRETLLYTLEPFDSHYQLIEDWPFFLSQTRAGKHVLFCNFPALLHRQGGISTTTNRNMYIQEKYDADILRILEEEVLPYLYLQPFFSQEKIFARYENSRGAYCAQYGNWYGPPLWKFILSNKKFFLKRWLLSRYRTRKQSIKVHGAALLIIWSAWLLTIISVNLSSNVLGRLPDVLAEYVFPIFVIYEAVQVLLDMSLTLMMAIRHMINKKGDKCS